MVSLSDRRFKREIRPLIKALPKARKRLTLPLHRLHMKCFAPDLTKGPHSRTILAATEAMSDVPEEKDQALSLAAECGKHWPTMLSKPEETREGLLEISEADAHTIKVDVLRTRGNHPAFGPEMRDRLKALLTELCLKEGLRYMQGLHEVAAIFAYIESTSGFKSDDSSPTLSCFIAFIRTFMPCFYDGESFVILHITLLFFRQLLLYHLPHLHNQLEDAGVAPVVYATPWFITLFAYKNPLHVTMRLWHEYIRRGDPTFVAFLAVALMEIEKQAFLNAQEDDFNCAVDGTRITSLEKLRDVWKAAENLHSRTPKSFTFRMSKGLNPSEATTAEDWHWPSMDRKCPGTCRARASISLAS